MSGRLTVGGVRVVSDEDMGIGDGPNDIPPVERWPWYDLVIRRKSDGVTITLRERFIDDENARFMCSPDGNYGCDCNRHLFFLRAQGLPSCATDESTQHPCGDKVYEYVSVTSVVGGRVVHRDRP